MVDSSSKSELSLVDLTALPRIGVKGKDLTPWIESKAYVVGEQSNRAYSQHDGTLIARLSPGELLLLANSPDPSDDVMAFSLEATYSCYPVRRQDSHYWFSLSGERCSEMLAKLCAVDVSTESFANHSVAQTSVAKTSAIIVRDDSSDNLRYYLMGDSSTAQYMHSCLIDAMTEFISQ
jgi:sarcosine oxidase subunit gamma